MKQLKHVSLGILPAKTELQKAPEEPAVQAVDDRIDSCIIL